MQSISVEREVQHTEVLSGVINWNKVAVDVLNYLDPTGSLPEKAQVLIELALFYKTEHQQTLDSASPEEMHRHFVEHRQKLRGLIGEKKLTEVFGSENEIEIVRPSPVSITEGVLNCLEPTGSQPEEKKEQALAELALLNETEHQQTLKGTSPEETHQHLIKHHRKLRELIGGKKLAKVFGPESDVTCLLPTMTSSTAATSTKDLLVVDEPIPTAMVVREEKQPTKKIKIMNLTT